MTAQPTTENPTLRALRPRPDDLGRCVQVSFKHATARALGLRLFDTEHPAELTSYVRDLCSVRFLATPGRPNADHVETHALRRCRWLDRYLVPLPATPDLQDRECDFLVGGHQRRGLLCRPMPSGAWLVQAKDYPDRRHPQPPGYGEFCAVPPAAVRLHLRLSPRSTRVSLHRPDPVLG